MQTVSHRLAPFGPQLAEECGHAPKVGLLPLWRKRVLVTLRALDLYSQEQPRAFGRQPLRPNFGRLAVASLGVDQDEECPRVRGRHSPAARGDVEAPLGSQEVEDHLIP